MINRKQADTSNEEFHLVMGKEAIILSLLTDGREQYGLEMVKNSEGKLKRAAIYVFLHRMENQGLISSRLVDDSKHSGGARRKYRIEALGRRALAARHAAEQAFASFEWAPAG